MLLDRLPTRVNLGHGLLGRMEICLVCLMVLLQNLHCIFFYSVLFQHLFGFISSIGWGLLCLLLRPWLFFVMFDEGYNRKVRKGDWYSLWHAIIWCIWELRNGIIFGPQTADFIYLLDRVKICSSRWFSACSKREFVSFQIDVQTQYPVFQMQGVLASCLACIFYPYIIDYCSMVPL